MPNEIKLTQKEAAQGLTHRIVAIATECAEAGMPPAAITVAVMSAGIGLSCKDDGPEATTKWLRDVADKLQATSVPRSQFLPGGTV